MPRNGIAGSYGNSIFSFLRNLHTALIVALPIYIPTNSGMVPFSSHPLQHFFLNLFIYLLIYLILAALGPRLCARAFFSCGERGPLFIPVRGPLTIAASLVAEHRLQTHRLSSCGSRAQLLRGMWDPPRPGLEPASPALAGRLSTTAPPGKPSSIFYL